MGDSGHRNSDRSNWRSLGQLPQSCTRPAILWKGLGSQISKTEGLEEEAVWGPYCPCRAFSVVTGMGRSPLWACTMKRCLVQRLEGLGSNDNVLRRAGHHTKRVAYIVGWRSHPQEPAGIPTPPAQTRKPMLRRSHNDLRPRHTAPCRPPAPPRARPGVLPNTLQVQAWSAWMKNGEMVGITTGWVPRPEQGRCRPGDRRTAASDSRALLRLPDSS